jgi:hypothetical protein
MFALHVAGSRAITTSSIYNLYPPICFATLQLVYGYRDLNHRKECANTTGLLKMVVGVLLVEGQLASDSNDVCNDEGVRCSELEETLHHLVASRAGAGGAGLQSYNCCFWYIR